MSLDWSFPIHGWLNVHLCLFLFMRLHRNCRIAGRGKTVTELLASTASKSSKVIRMPWCEWKAIVGVLRRQSVEPYRRLLRCLRACDPLRAETGAASR